jgi:hypothetical protein
MLSDLNSDFGLNNAPLVVTGLAAAANLIKNVFRTSPFSDRFDYIEMGLALEKTLKEPATAVGAKAVFMIIDQCLSYNLPNINLDVKNSVVVANPLTGEYEVTIALVTGESITFSL